MATPQDHEHFLVTQAIILRDPGDRVLILQHKGGKWLFPGGRLKKGENWLQGLTREVQEETGISSMSHLEVICVDTWETNDGPCYGIFFRGALSKNTSVILSDEHIAFLWVYDQEQLTDLEFWHNSLKEILLKEFKTRKG